MLYVSLFFFQPIRALVKLLPRAVHIYLPSYIGVYGVKGVSAVYMHVNVCIVAECGGNTVDRTLGSGAAMPRYCGPSSPYYPFLFRGVGGAIKLPASSMGLASGPATILIRRYPVSYGKTKAKKGNS